MPTNNQTLIAIPLDVTNDEELRIFLSKLVIALDLIIGFRGDESPFVTKVSLAEQLESDVIPIDVYEQTISPTYVQAEMQAMSDAVTALTDKVNEIIEE